MASRGAEPEQLACTKTEALGTSLVFGINPSITLMYLYSYQYPIVADSGWAQAASFVCWP